VALRHARRLLGQRGMARETGERRPWIALKHLHELSRDPGPHGSGVEARLPVGELRWMTGAARLGLERGLERGEARRRRALGRERAAPVTVEELPDRVGAGGVDGAERRQRGDQHRPVAKPHGEELSSAWERGRVIPLMDGLDKGCYLFLRTSSQNPRESTILTGAAAAISRRSRSPVTSTSV